MCRESDGYVRLGKGFIGSTSGIKKNGIKVYNSSGIFFTWHSKITRETKKYLINQIKRTITRAEVKRLEKKYATMCKQKIEDESSVINI